MKLSNYTFVVMSLLIVGASHYAAIAQPAIQWQTLIGGSSNDQAYAIQQTPDGGFIATGFGSSNDGQFADHHGSTSTRDCIVMRLDSSGKVRWTKSLGGSGNDLCPCMAQSPGGGFLIAGGAASVDGDVWHNHGAAGTSDCWIVKLNDNGDTLWTRTYGGSADDDILRIIPTSDDGYVFAARCNSNDGDVTGHHGTTSNSDFWLVKIDSIGNLLWQKSLGGTGYDSPFGLARTPDGAFVLCGNTTSNDGDVKGYHGSGDTWVVKVSGTGAIIWEHAFGSSGGDDNNTVTVTTDGGYIVGGSAYTKGGDIANHYGHTDEYDMWVFKLSPDGTLLWSKTYGGSGHDYEQDVHATPDGGCLLSGYSTSNDIDVSGHHGDTTGYDAWIVKLDSVGNIEWQKSIGGTKLEGASGITPTRDGGCAIAANTQSMDGDLLGIASHGAMDAWIIKLSPFEKSSTFIREEAATSGMNMELGPIAPNPFAEGTRIGYSLKARSAVSVVVVDLLGRIVARPVAAVQDRGEHSAWFDARSLPAGVYSCRLSAGDATGFGMLHHLVLH